jgi:hypothetical protein
VKLCPVGLAPGPGLRHSHRRSYGAGNTAGGRGGWPVILRHLGRGHGRSPDHRPHGGCSAFAGGGETHESRQDRQLYGIEVTTDVNPWRLLRQGTATPGDAGKQRFQKPEPWKPELWKAQLRKSPSPRSRSAPARLATRCTAPPEVATGLSTLDSDHGDPVHEQQAGHASHGPNGAAHCGRPKVGSHYRRCLPTHRACRAAPTLLAGASDPESGPPRRLPS